MVGRINDEILRKHWNECADNLHKLYIHYTFEKPTEKSLNQYKENVLEKVRKYENRLNKIGKTHAQANPGNKDFDFRDVLTKYNLPNVA